MMAEEKYKAPPTFKNYAKIFMVTNTLPMTTETTDGFYRRTLLLCFNKVYDTNKHILDTIPDWEFENLAYKSIKIVKNLLEHGKFQNEKSVKEKRIEYDNLSNPSLNFIRENCYTGDFDKKSFGV